MEILLKSIEQYSLIWIIISAGVGGLIGATIKFIFDQVFSPRLKKNRDSKEVIKKYKFPFIQSLGSLDRRIELMMKFKINERNEVIKDDYYKMSNLFVFGFFLGWCKIINDEAIFKFEPSTKKTRKFHIHYSRIFKALSSFKYFRDINEFSNENIREASISQLILVGIGELMIKNPDDRFQKDFPEIIGYVEFNRRYKESAEFRKWFSSLERFFSEIYEKNNIIAWNRLVLLSINVRIFLAFLDSRKSFYKHRKIKYFDTLHSAIAQRVKMELHKSSKLRIE